MWVLNLVRRVRGWDACGITTAHSEKVTPNLCPSHILVSRSKCLSGNITMDCIVFGA